MNGKKRLLAIGGSLALILGIFGGLWFWRSVGSQPLPLLRKEREMSQYRRILAVSPALQEIVLALAPPEQIVAVSASSKNSPIPEVAQAARQVAGEVSERPSTEELLALDPDIVLMPVVFSRAQADLLADMKVNVVPLGIPNSYEELKARIMLIADALGLSDKGRTLTATMDQKIAMVNEKNHRMFRGSPKFFSAGKKEFMALCRRIFFRAGGRYHLVAIHGN
ncbi:MAG: ABC transporter substrate-binding protein [Schwartzia sp. (in: firmicutes)]